MRTFRRVLFLFSCICGWTALTQAQGGANSLNWQRDYPAPTVGGVDVAVSMKAVPGYTCTDVTFRIIDDATSVTLVETVFQNPGSSASKSYTGLDNNLKVRVTADATFKSGGTFQFKDLETTVTTQ